jgi:alpha-tubulin suppressor-like RCC1 family protein
MSNLYRIDKGINLRAQSTTPSSPVDGDIYHDSALGQLRAYIAGSWEDISATGGGGGVDSAFGRTGAVTAQSGDYTTAQVTESGSLYFTNTRAITAPLTGYSSTTGTVSATDSILQAIQKLDGNTGLKQTAIQFKNEGSNLGTSGTVSAIDFVGSSVTASVVGPALTVNITSSSPVYDTYYDNGTNALINFTNGNTQKFTLSTSSVLELYSPNKAGDYYILVTSTGSFSLTPPNNSVVENGPIPSFTAGQSRLLRAVYNNSYYTISYSAAFAMSTPYAAGLGAGIYSTSDKNVMYAWGTNNIGELGNNTTTAAGSPTKNNFRLLHKFATTGSSKFGIDPRTGMIYAWGLNTGGGLGNNTLTNTSSPVTIARTGSYSMVAAQPIASSATSNALAIDAATGMVWTWGSNTFGQIGNSTGTNTSSPVTISRTGSYRTIAAGINTNYAIDASTGMIWGWGLGTTGQLGNNNIVSTSSPVTISRTGSYRTIAAGNAFALAIDAATGMVWAWGNNGSSSLGTNIAVASVSSPVTIARTGSYSAVAASGSVGFAIDGGTGMIWAWGAGTNGGLGNNTTTTVSSPVTIARTGSYSQIATANGSTSWAVEAATGIIFGWGNNITSSANAFTAGFGLSSVSSSPNTIPRTTSYNKVYAGASAAGVIDPVTGMITYWGQFVAAYGATQDIYNELARTSSYSQISFGTNAAYVIDAADGMIWSWGTGTGGQIGNNTLTSTSSPVTIARTGSYSQVASSTNNAYAIDASTGMIYSWGVNTNGSLGNNTGAVNVSSPVTISRTSSYSKIASGGNTAYAIDAGTGMIWVWGEGFAGQLGDNTTGAYSSPVTIARTGSYSAITAGASNAYAIEASTGMIWAWGSVFGVGIGGNSTGARSSPVTIARTGSYSQVVNSASTAFAIDAATGMIWGWGRNDAGQIGDNTLTNTSSPVTIARTGSYSAIAASANAAYAIEASTGRIYSWGAVYRGINVLSSSSSPISIGRLY